MEDLENKLEQKYKPVESGFIRREVTYVVRTYFEPLTKWLPALVRRIRECYKNSK